MNCYHYRSFSCIHRTYGREFTKFSACAINDAFRSFRFIFLFHNVTERCMLSMSSHLLWNVLMFPQKQPPCYGNFWCHQRAANIFRNSINWVFPQFWCAFSLLLRQQFHSSMTQSKLGIYSCRFEFLSRNFEVLSYRNQSIVFSRPPFRLHSLDNEIAFIKK